MNYGIIAYVLGWILNIEAVLMMPAGIVALIYREKDGMSILISMILCLVFGI